MKLSVCIEPIGAKLPFVERIGMAATAGFAAVEFWSWQNKDIAAAAEAAKRHRVAVAAFVGSGNKLVDPGQRATFQAEIRASIEKNLSIPEKVASREVDVMITDNIEAMVVSRQDSRLHAVDPENTYTKDDFGYLLPRDESAWINYVNLWVDLAKLKGDFARLQQKWIR